MLRAKRSVIVRSSPAGLVRRSPSPVSAAGLRTPGLSRIVSRDRVGAVEHHLARPCRCRPARCRSGASGVPAQLGVADGAREEREAVVRRSTPASRSARAAERLLEVREPAATAPGLTRPLTAEPPALRVDVPARRRGRRRRTPRWASATQSSSSHLSCIDLRRATGAGAGWSSHGSTASSVFAREGLRRPGDLQRRESRERRATAFEQCAARHLLVHHRVTPFNRLSSPSHRSVEESNMPARSGNPLTRARSSGRRVPRVQTSTTTSPSAVRVEAHGRGLASRRAGTGATGRRRPPRRRAARTAPRVE